ncbi:hypothetical protein [Streptomyces monashensis]|uniref:hypothetical protein n=1 Tax=Streptomyces monashensis TaxID=1678012 RepID=UPI00116018FA|nr:hypothetical protein [Streptomyces monashensis]
MTIRKHGRDRLFKVLGVTVSVLVIAGLAISALMTHSSSANSAEPITKPAGKLNPRATLVPLPMGRFAVLAAASENTRPSNWSPLAWVTGGTECYGVGEVSAPDHPHQVACGPAQVGWNRPGTPKLWTKPHFVAQLFRGSSMDMLAIGFVQGSASTVDVTMTSGRTIKSHVVPLPAPNPGLVGAYSLWLPTDSGRVGWNDIRHVVAKNASGAPIAELG